MSNIEGQNLDIQEQQKFDAIANGWWDPQGPFRPLHDLNPSRLKYIKDHCQLKGARVLDVGCGGGILAESLAREKATVTAIDIAPKVLGIARLHLLESRLEIDYRLNTIEEIAAEHPGEFDVITCMEMLEHVPDPESVIRSVSRAVRPGGCVFFSTLNRTPASFLMGIVGAEYIARLLPRGTHRYDRFIRPSELGSWLRSSGLELEDISGLHYNPVGRYVKLGGNVNVNYLVFAQRPSL